MSDEEQEDLYIPQHRPGEPMQVVFVDRWVMDELDAFLSSRGLTRFPIPQYRSHEPDLPTFGLAPSHTVTSTRPALSEPDPADPLADAIAREAEAAFVTHYVVVAATVDQDGNSGTHMIPSPGLPLWMQHGLLAYEAAATVPQPFYGQPDDDEGAEP